MQWYDQTRRNLPWRDTPDPYKVWLSEIILQQTRVTQGLPYYLRFISSFPDVQSLARASQDDILLHWKGLGYYSRALNLQKTAQKIVKDFNGNFPQTTKDLQSLPGIGAYTAAAIGSICFGLPTPAIDGNLYRVLSRFFADATDISASGAWKHFESLALKLMPTERAGDFNQAMMDLGAEVCTPKNPRCPTCPIHPSCQAYLLGQQSTFPVKKKKKKPVEVDIHYQFLTDGEQFIVTQRDNTSIWKNLWEFPPAVPNINQADYTKTHLLSHRRLHLYFYQKNLCPIELQDLAKKEKLHLCTDPSSLAFPRPIESFLEKFFSKKEEHQTRLNFT